MCIEGPRCEKPSLCRMQKTKAQINLLTCVINPFKPNGIFYSNQMDQSILALRVVRWYFSFFANFNTL